MNMLKRFDDWKSGLYDEKKMVGHEKKKESGVLKMRSAEYLKVPGRISKIIPNFSDRISPFY